MVVDARMFADELVVQIPRAVDRDTRFRSDRHQVERAEVANVTLVTRPIRAGVVRTRTGSREVIRLRVRRVY